MKFISNWFMNYEKNWDTFILYYFMYIYINILHILHSTLKPVTLADVLGHYGSIHPWIFLKFWNLILCRNNTKIHKKSYPRRMPLD